MKPFGLQKALGASMDALASTELMLNRNDRLTFGGRLNIHELGKMDAYTKDYYDAIGRLGGEWALLVGLISMPTISHVGYCLAESPCDSAVLAIG